MDSIEIYKTHLKLLDGIIISDIEDFDGFLTVKSYLNDNWYDSITITDPEKLDVNELKEVEENLKKNKVDYALYFPTDLLPRIQNLITPEYKRVGGDAYLALNNLEHATLLPDIEIVEVDDNNFKIYKQLIEQIHGIEMGWPAASKFADILFEKQKLHFDKKAYLNIAFYKNKPVGYSTSIISNSMNLIYISSSGVLVEYRGKGIYAIMVNYSINKAIKEGVKTAYVITGQESKSWHASRKLGYKEVGRFEYYLKN